MSANKRQRENSSESIDVLDENDQQEGKKSKTATIPRILDGKYFTIVSNVDSKIEAKCTQCHKKIKGQISSTGNFKLHYRTVHNSTLSTLENYLKNKGDEVGEKNTGRQSSMAQFASNLNPDKVL